MHRSRFHPAGFFFEAEIAPGLETISWSEIRRLFQDTVQLHAGQRSIQPGTIQFDYTGDPGSLTAINTAIAVYGVLRLPIPRPKALLGDQNFRAVLKLIDEIRSRYTKGTFQTLYLSAAGSHSSMMERFKDQLQQRTGLQVASHPGDLMMRLKRPVDGAPGWDLLIRLTPRPLSLRSWRVCDWEGALNASVAHAMVLLSRPRPDETVINLTCGSGSLMIERLNAAPASLVVGFDLDPKPLECAHDNLVASGKRWSVELIRGDASTLPVMDRGADSLLADLPFGQRVGSHADNLELYPRLLSEAARVARSGGVFVVITHEIKLIESLLRSSEDWKVDEVVSITLGGLHPRIYRLLRVG